MGTLITGGGLVGSHVAAALISAGQRVVLLDVNPNRPALARVLDLDAVQVRRVDLLDLPEIIRAITENGLGTIIHTASLTYDTGEHPYRGVRANIEGFANVYEAARLTGIKRVVISSAPGTTARLAPSSHRIAEGIYGTTKLFGEQLGFNYHDLYGMGFCVIRYPAVVPPMPDTFHFVPNTDVFRAAGGAIPAMVKAALSGERVSFKDRVLTWGYAKDVARGTVLAATLDAADAEVFFLATGLATLSDANAVIREMVPASRVEVVADAAPSSGQPPRPDVGQARAHAEKLLGYVPEYDLRRMIEEIVHNAR